MITVLTVTQPPTPITRTAEPSFAGPRSARGRGLGPWWVVGALCVLCGCDTRPAATLDIELQPELPPMPPIEEDKPLEPGVVIPVSPRAAADEQIASGEDEQGPPIAVADFIVAAMHEQARRFAAGMVVATPMFRGSLVNGATQDFQAILQPAHCFKIVGVGGPTVKDLDLLLFDPNGMQVQQDTATDSYPVLGLHQPICPTSPGAYRVQVRMYKGAGDFGVQVFHTR